MTIRVANTVMVPVEEYETLKTKAVDSLEAYNKGLADGIESSAILCEKAYGYETPLDIARRIRSIDRTRQT